MFLPLNLLPIGLYFNLAEIQTRKLFYEFYGLYLALNPIKVKE